MHIHIYYFNTPPLATHYQFQRQTKIHQVHNHDGATPLTQRKNQMQAGK